MLNTNARMTAAAFREQYNAYRTQTENDQRLSPETRQRRLAAALRTTRNAIAALRPAHEAEITVLRQSLQVRVFGKPDGADDDAYRRALDTVTDLTAEQLSQRMLRAQRIGDPVMERACYVAAVEKAAARPTVAPDADAGAQLLQKMFSPSKAGGDFEAVVMRYGAAHPDDSRHLEALRTFEAELQDRSGAMEDPLRPPIVPFELKRLNNDQIDRLAAEVDTAPGPSGPGMTDSRMPLLQPSAVQSR